MTIYSYRTSRNKMIELEISTNSCGVQRNENKKKKGSTCSNFISIEFEYQNSGYSHDSMGQVHLFFFY